MNVVKTTNNMKSFNSLLAVLLLTGLAATPFAARAADKKADAPKPYTLKTCPVSGEELGADPSMKPYAFTHEGREIKLCCKGCLKDFTKDAANYVKKIEAAEKKAAK